jgi:hypothetical protein
MVLPLLAGSRWCHLKWRRRPRELEPDTAAQLDSHGMNADDIAAIVAAQERT